jgi:hypothetical protein
MEVPMPQVAYLDGKTEQRLQQALTKVSEHIADGDDATEAIVKVARAVDLSRGQVELLVRAYNTGRTLFQFDNADSLQEKLADFPLADAEEATAALFPDRVKTAAESQYDNNVSADYQISPRNWLARLERDERAEKSAQILVTARRERKLTKAAAYERQSDALDIKLAATRDASLANQSLAATQYAAADAFHKLATYFHSPGAVPLASMRTNAMLVHGEKAAAVLDEIAADNPRLLKVAQRLHAVDWTKQPYSLLQTIFEKAAAYVAAVQANTAAQQKHQEAREVLYGPFVPPPTGGSAWDSLSSETEENDKLAATPNPALWAGIGSGMANSVKSLYESAFPNKDNIVKGYMAKLQDPGHEQGLRQIRTQTLLSDLMLNDPVISGYGQDEVLDAYTRLSEVAPGAVQHKLLAQALLGKYLEQGNRLEPFDMDQLIDIENKLKPAEAPATASAVAK